jgi:hypothetical protein
MLWQVTGEANRGESWIDLVFREHEPRSMYTYLIAMFA